jgi:hypothetical protein
VDKFGQIPAEVREPPEVGNGILDKTKDDILEIDAEAQYNYLKQCEREINHT